MRTVLEGSVRRSASRLRVTAQLIDVLSGYHLWSDRYDRQIADVFDIQDEIAGNIVKALRVVLTAREHLALKKAATRDVAYEYYFAATSISSARPRELRTSAGTISPRNRDRSELCACVRRDRELGIVPIHVSRW